jgi:hypothetical protein
MFIHDTVLVFPVIFIWFISAPHGIKEIVCKHQNTCHYERCRPPPAVNKYRYNLPKCST